MRPSLLIYWCIGLLLSLPQTIITQSLPHYHVQHFDTRDGLSNNWVSALTTDKKGYLWIGTQYGLNRFDGHSFHTYTYSANEPHGLAGNWVRQLYVSIDQTLWISPEGPTHTRLDISKDKFIVGQEALQFQPFSTNETETVANGGSLLVALSSDGTPIPKMATNPIRRESGEVFWAGTRNSLLRCTAKGECENVLSKATINDILVLGPDSLLLFKDQSLVKLYRSKNDDWITEELDIQAQNHPQFFYTPFLYRDPSGYIWASGLNGIWRISDDLRTKSWLPLRELLPYQSESLPSVHCIHVDQNEVVWLGTSQGLLQLSPTKNFVHPQLNSVAGRLPNIRTIIAQDNRYLFAGPTSLLYWQAGQSTPEEITKGVFVSLHEDQQANIYGVGKVNDNWQLIKIDMLDGQIQQLPCSLLATQNRSNWKIIKSDQRGRLWISNWQDVICFSPEDGSSFVLTLEKSSTNEIESLGITDLLIDHEDRLWLGTIRQGLISINNISTLEAEDRASFRQHLHETDLSTSISSNLIQALHLDRENRLWIGTDGGLNLWTGTESQFRRWIRNDNMPDDKILDITEDNLGDLWLSTASRGILLFQPATEHFQSFTKREGLYSDDMLIGSSYTDKDGQLWLGSSLGLHGFKPEEVKNRIEEIDILRWQTLLRYQTDTIKQEVFPEDEYSEEQPLIIRPDDHTVQLSFAWLNFRYAGQQRYEYRLDNLQTDWLPAPNDGILSLSQLPPGRYILHVRSYLPGKQIVANALPIYLRVQPPWYLTKVAYLIYLLTALGAIYLGYRTQLARQLAAAEQAQARELVASKLRFFQQIAHEFRSPLTLVFGAIEQLKRRLQKQETDKVTPQLKQLDEQAQYLTRQVDEILELAKLQADRSPLQTQLADFVQYQRFLLLSFSSLAEEQDIQLSFRATRDTLYFLFDADKWRKITSNLVSNALRFTPVGGTITLSLDVSTVDNKSQLHYSLSDNGSGIDPAFIEHIFEPFSQAKEQEKQGTGIGLTLTKALVEQHGGTIEIESSLGKGSCFNILLPIQAIESPSITPQTAAEKDRPLILVAEDHRAIRTYLRECLADQYEIIEAENGKIAWEICLREVPDLVISDVMMPGESGLEFSQRIRGNERTNHIPLMLLTGKKSQEDRLSGLQAGADVYLTKPFHREELLIRIQGILTSRQRLQQKYQAGDFSIQTTTQATDTFMKQVAKIISEEIDNEDLSVEALAKQLHLSRVQLFRKIKALTGITPTLFIRQIRLQHAQKLLRESDQSISEIAYASGFKDPAYFSRVYKEQFGQSPSEIRP